METKDITREEKINEHFLATMRQMVANKRAFEKQEIENYKNDPKLQALIAKLNHKNAERGTPIA